MTNKNLSSFLCQRYPQHIFIYGDNYNRRGRGGQAIIRNEPNTLGLVTKWYPSDNANAYFRDDDMNASVQITTSFERILDILDQGKSIVLSSQGYGNGYARLPIVAPKLFKKLCDHLNTLCGKVIYQ